MAGEGDRPEIVLVPGFMQGGRSWAAVTARIDRRYRALALDHRAHDFGGRLREIEAAAAPRAALVGYSLGGRLVLHAALRAATQAGRYGAVVLVGASAGIEDPVKRSQRRADDERLAAWIEGQPVEAVVDRWERTPALAGQPAEMVAAQRADRLAHDPARLAELLRSAGQGTLVPVWERLRGLGAPLLALAGDRDTGYVEAAERLAALAPRGHARTIPNAGHAAHLEQTDAFAAALLEFLDDHLGERRLVDGDA